MSNFSFVIPGEPVAKGRPRAALMRKRDGTPFVREYTPDKTRQAEQTLVARVVAFRPPTPIAGPIALTVRFVMPIPASWSKRKQFFALDRPHTSKPDTDNMLKLVKDALTGVFWLDDAQIYAVTVSKVYGLIPQTEITITEEATPIPVMTARPAKPQQSIEECPV